MPQIICLGILVADILGHPIDTLPARGALQLVASIAPYIGGCAANTGIGLQKLGIETLVVGQVGRDGLGDFVLGELERAGVQAQISRDEGAPTSATMVLVSSDAERSFLHCTGANATLSPQNFGFLEAEGAELLHIAGHGLMPRFDGAPCAALLRCAREIGLKTSLDTAGAPDEAWRENLRLCLPHLDYFVPSLHEVEALFPDAKTPREVAARLLEAGVGTVALKMGERGSLICTRDAAFEVAPFEVDAVDATGAGDAFAAGFLAGVTKGFSPDGCARLGNAVGALCVTRIGTVAGVLELEATLKWMENR